MSILRNATRNSYPQSKGHLRNSQWLTQSGENKRFEPPHLSSYLGEEANSARRSGTLFRGLLEISPKRPRGKTRLQPLRRLILRRDLC
jgi:hypothetical protein